MKKVSDILTRKGTAVYAVSPGSTILIALQLMADKNIGSVMVMDGDKYVGMMTERDYSRKVILKGKTSTASKVEEIMTTDVPKINSNDSIEHCMQLMSARNTRYLPVFEGDAIKGIISISDVVKETILSQEETITELKDYLHAQM